MKSTAVQEQWFDKIYAAAREFSPPKDDTYLSSYPHLLKSFLEARPLTEDRIVTLIHAVFGWMPTTLDLNFADVSAAELRDSALSLSDSDQKGNELNESIQILFSGIGTLPKRKGQRNKSIVGVSKLLHFLYPSIWPIWDKTVGTELGGWYSRDKVATYQTFALELRRLANTRGAPIQKLANDCLKKAGYDYQVNRIRALEMVLFFKGKHKGAARMGSNT